MNRLSLLFLLFSLNTAFCQINWEPLNGPTGNNFVDFAIDQDGYYHLRSKTTVDSYLISRDSGQTWQPSTNIFSSVFNFKRFFKGTDELLYIVEKNNIKRWENSEWVNVFSQSFQEPIIDAALTYENKFIIVTKNKIYSSDYEGLSIEEKLIRPFSNDIEISINPSGNHFLISSTHESNIIKFYDNLQSFSNLLFVPSISASPRLINSFLLAPTSEIIVGVKFGVLVSKDNGTTWDAKSLIQAASNQQPTVLKVFYHLGKIYAITHNEIFVSSNKGDSWTKYSTFERDFYGASSINLISFDNTVFAYSDIDCKTIFKSKNQLLNWENVRLEFKNPDVSQIYKSQNSEILYAKSCRNKYQYSKNQGDNWEQIKFPDSRTSFGGLIFSDSSKIFVSKFQSNEILRTSDFGDNWELASKALDTVSTGFFHLNYNPLESELWAISYNDPTYVSLDYGETWLNSPMPPDHQPWHLYFLENGMAYSFNSNYSEALIRKNNSANWEPIQTPTFDSTVNIRSLSPMKDGSFFIVTQEGRISNKNFSIYQFNPFDETLEKKFDSEDELQFFLTKDDELLSWYSRTSSLQISYDLGLNWESNNTGLPNIRINTIYEDNQGFLYLGLEEEVIYKSNKPVSNIQELSQNKSFTVFPNPTFSDVSIHSISNKNVVSVYNMWGRKLMERTVDKDQFSISIAHLPKGTYIISLKNEKGNNQAQKLIKL